MNLLIKRAVGSKALSFAWFGTRKSGAASVMLSLENLVCSFASLLIGAFRSDANDGSYYSRLLKNVLSLVM